MRIEDALDPRMIGAHDREHEPIGVFRADRISRESFCGPYGFSMNLSADCLRSGRVLRCAIVSFIHYRGLKWKRFD